MPDLPEELRHLAAEQRGLLTRRQLRRHGISDSRQRTAFGTQWRLVLPGVVALFTGELTPDQRLTASWLFAGRRALLTGPKACELYGVSSGWVRAYPYYRFVVPATHVNRSADFAVVRRSERRELHPRMMREVPVVSAARAIGDAARLCRSARDARHLAISAIQTGLVPRDVLVAEGVTGPVRDSAALRRGLREFDAGAWSVSEADLRALLAESAILPPAMFNPHLATTSGLVLPTPDAWLDEVCLAVQLHSREFHSRDEDWEQTVMSDAVLTEHGVMVCQVTPRAVRRDPDRTLRHIERTYLTLVRRGERPPLVATERHFLDLPAA